MNLRAYIFSFATNRILTLGANVGTVCEILLELVPQLDDVSNIIYLLTLFQFL